MSLIESIPACLKDLNSEGVIVPINWPVRSGCFFLERKTLANISAVKLGQLAEATAEERLVSPTNAIGLAMQAALRQMQAAGLDTRALEQGLRSYRQLCSNLDGFRRCMIQDENKPLKTDLGYTKTSIGREILDVYSEIEEEKAA